LPPQSGGLLCFVARFSRQARIPVLASSSSEWSFLTCTSAAIPYHDDGHYLVHDEGSELASQLLIEIARAWLKTKLLPSVGNLLGERRVLHVRGEHLSKGARWDEF
jgi:hypothetical protein